MAPEFDNDLNAIIEDIRSALLAAPLRADHPFRTAVFGTQGPSGPEMRTVILRETGETGLELDFHTDARSPKINQIRACPRVHWLFYDAARRVQLRIRGTAHVHWNDEIAAAAWAGVTAAQRRNYGTRQAPGTEAPAPDQIESLPADSPSIEAHFAVVRTLPNEIDYLELGADRHRRARFEPDGTRWRGTWIVP